MSEADDVDDELDRAGFLRTLNDALGPRRMAVLATALILLATDPIQFVRVFVLEGVVVLLLDGLLGAIEWTLQSFAAAWTWLGLTVYAATVGVVTDMLRTLAESVLLPVVFLTESFSETALLRLGIAAPLAAALATAFTVILFVVIGTVVYQLVETWLPLDALGSMVTAPLVALWSFLGTGAQRVRGLVGGLRNRGDT